MKGEGSIFITFSSLGHTITISLVIKSISRALCSCGHKTEANKVCQAMYGMSSICWFGAGPPSVTVIQHQNSRDKSRLRVRLPGRLFADPAVAECSPTFHRHWVNVHRRSEWQQLDKPNVYIDFCTAAAGWYWLLLYSLQGLPVQRLPYGCVMS